MTTPPKVAIKFGDLKVGQFFTHQGHDSPVWIKEQPHQRPPLKPQNAYTMVRLPGGSSNSHLDHVPDDEVVDLTSSDDWWKYVNHYIKGKA